MNHSKIQSILDLLLGRLPATHPFGIIAEFDSADDLLRAARGVREHGIRAFDVHSPYPIHDMERAMGLPRSRVPWVVLLGGVTGGLVGLALQTWINVVDYPLVISDKPHFSLPAFIPVTFELTILLSAIGAVGAMLLFNLLPMFYHPLFKHPGFASVTTDGFYLTIEARDPGFDPERCRAILASLGGCNIALLEP